MSITKIITIGYEDIFVYIWGEVVMVTTDMRVEKFDIFLTFLCNETVYYSVYT